MKLIRFNRESFCVFKESDYSENVTGSNLNQFASSFRCAIAIVMVLMLCVGRVWGQEPTLPPLASDKTWVEKFLEEYPSPVVYQLEGKGTAEEPYSIRNAYDLAFLAYSINVTNTALAGNFKNKSYQLVNDIDLGDAWWVPIGNIDKFNQYFEGTFDGNGYTIRNMYIDWGQDPSNANQLSFGLFSMINGTANTKYAAVRNLYFENAILSSTADLTGNRNVGVLAGRLQGYVIVENVAVVNSSVVRLTNNIKNVNYIGGIAGVVESNYDYKISNCVGNLKVAFHDNGNPKDKVHVGGLFGRVLWNFNPSINDAMEDAFGHVDIFRNDKVDNDPISPVVAVGGAIGGSSDGSGLIVNVSERHADHTKAQHTFSLRAFDTQAQDVTDKLGTITWNVGGSVKSGKSVVMNTSRNDMAGSVSFTNPTTHATVTRSFTSKAEHWRLDAAHIYTDAFAGGSGTKADPYLISNAAELVFLQNKVNTGVNATAGQYYALTGDVDLANARWHTIGQTVFLPNSSDFSKCFQGVFDGRGQTINNMYIDLDAENVSAERDYNIGLFSKIAGQNGFYATVANLIVTNAMIEEDQCIPIVDAFLQNRIDNIGIVVGFANEQSNVQNIIVRTSKIQYNAHYTIPNDYDPSSGKRTYIFQRRVGGVVGELERKKSSIANIAHIYSDVKIDVSNSFGTLNVGSVIGINDANEKFKTQDIYARNQITYTQFDTRLPVAKISNIGGLNSALYDTESVFYSASTSTGYTHKYGKRITFTDVHCDSIKTIFNRNIITTGQNLDEVALPQGYNNLLTWAYDEDKNVFYFLPVAAALRNVHEATHRLPYHDLTFYFKDEKGVDQTNNYTYRWGLEGQNMLWEASVGNKAKWKTLPQAQICDITANKVGEPTWHETFILAAESWKYDQNHLYADHFAKGNGSKANPYQITDGAELQYLNTWLENNNATAGKYFYLANDINLFGAEWKPIGYVRYDAANFNYFNGIFDGRANVIKNMTVDAANIWNDNIVNKEYNYGLFSTVAGKPESSVKAVVQNVTIENSELTAFAALSKDCRNMGLLAGNVLGNSQIRNVIIRNGKINDGGLSHTNTDQGFRVGGIIGTLEDTYNRIDAFALHADVDIDFALKKLNSKANTATTNPGASFGNIFGWVNVAKDLNYVFPSHLYALGSQKLPEAAKNVSSGTIYGNAQNSATYPKFRIGWYYGSDLTSNIANDKKFNQGAIEDDRYSIADRFNYAIRSIDEDNEFGLYDWVVDEEMGYLKFGTVPMLSETAWDDENSLYTLTIDFSVVPENPTYKWYVDSVLVIADGHSNHQQISYMLTGRDAFVEIYSNSKLYAVTNHITLSERVPHLMTVAEYKDYNWNILLHHDDINQTPYDYNFYKPDASNDDGYSLYKNNIKVNATNNKLWSEPESIAMGNAGDDIGPLFIEVFFRGTRIDGSLVNDKVYSNLRRKSFEMVDGYVYDIKEPFGVRTATYKRIYKKWVWQPLVLPYSLKFEDWAGRFDVVKLFDVHYILDENDDQIQEMKIQMIRLLWGSETEPNVPYMIRAIHPSETEVQTIEAHDVLVYPTTPYNAQCSNVEKDFSFISSYQGMGKNTYYAPDLTKKGTPEFDKGLTPDKSKAYNHPWPSSNAEKDKMGAVENKEIYVLTSGCWLPVTNTASLRPQRYYLRITDRTKNNPYKDSYSPKSIPTIRMEILGEGEMEFDDIESVETAIEEVSADGNAAAPIKVKAAEIGLRPGLYLIGGKLVRVEL